MGWLRSNAGLVTAIAIGTVVFFATSGSQLAEGKSAPTFDSVDQLGSKVSSSSLSKSGDYYLYFIKPGCPTNHDAISFYNDLASKYGSKIPFYGVIYGGKAQYNAWQREYRAPYKVILDPDKAIISKFRAARSPWVVQVTANGKIGKIWKGYSRDFLEELNVAVAKSMKTDPKKLSLLGAPKNPAYG